MPHGPQKIILIRAGRYDYAEVELTGSLQIVGPNNTGKTTLIQTLQFLYVDDLRTMNFGSYSLEDSLAYYFPGQYSYVLFECLGATGTCLVGWRGASKASGGEPERFRCLGPYDRDDFFDPRHQVREPRDINARLALKDFRIIKSAQEHREILLPPSGADGRGLGIISLRDADRFRRFRESLKDLLSLSSVTQEQMRERLLTLADIRVDVPALDVRRIFGDDYDQIRRRRDALGRFRKHEGAIRSLVDHHARLASLRAELKARWSDLRQRRQAFEDHHREQAASHEQTLARHLDGIRLVEAELRDRRADRDATLARRGELAARLDIIAERGREFAGYSPDLDEASRQNLKHEELRLTSLLAAAEGERLDKARLTLDRHRAAATDKTRTLADIDRLVITALRHDIPDADIDRAFRILNPELLRTPVGQDGLTARDPAQLLQLIRTLANRIASGTYEDSAVRIHLRQSLSGSADLPSADQLREEIAEHQKLVHQWESIVTAILERERLAGELRQIQTNLEDIQKRLFRHTEYLGLVADEPRLRRDLDEVEQAIARLDQQLGSLESRARDLAREIDLLRRARDDADRDYHSLLELHSGCLFPDFNQLPSTLPELPGDFRSAIHAYLKTQDQERRLREDVARDLATVSQFIGEAFNGVDESETVRNLAAELDALPDRTEALERDWNALIQGLRGTFAGVIKELDALKSVAADLNRQFARVRVSNLRSVRLEILESGDLVGWIKRLVDIHQPGLFDDDTQLDQTLRNFRNQISGSPLISYAQLFSLGLTVEGDDGARHRYSDLRQIESHGTTIAIKVLFNLLVLRRYLREGQCVVPFFLDEVQALDPANRHSILTTAQALGFIAITAAPEAISEVQALYFLQAQQGRIVLRQKHRVTVRRPPSPPDPSTP